MVLDIDWNLTLLKPYHFSGGNALFASPEYPFIFCIGQIKRKIQEPSIFRSIEVPAGKHPKGAAHGIFHIKLLGTMNDEVVSILSSWMNTSLLHYASMK